MKALLRARGSSLLGTAPIWRGRQFLFSLLVLLNISLAANAGSVRVWTNGGGGGTWNTAGNWSPSGVPGAGDTATFNSTSTVSCNVNANINTGCINIQSGYTGTITVANNKTLTLTGDYTQAAGTFIGDNKNFAISGNFALNGGSYTSTSGQLQVQNNFTVANGATFTHNSGLILFNNAGASVINLPSGAFTVYNLQFNSTAGTTITSNDTIVVAGTLTLSQNQVKGGFIRLPVGAAISINNMYAGGTTIIDVQGAIAVNPGGTAFNGIILNNASATCAPSGANCAMQGDVTIINGTFNCSSKNITMNGNFTQTGGTFTASSATTSFDMNFTHTGGTFTNSSGTLAFTSANNATVNFNNATLSLYKVTINKTSSANTVTFSANDTMAVTNAFTLTSGTFNSGYIKPTSTISFTSGFGGGTSMMLITTAATYTIPAAQNMTGITVNNASAIVSLTTGASVNFGNNINLITGTINCNANKLSITTPFNQTGGTFNCTTDTMRVNTTSFTVQTGATFTHNSGTVYFNSSTQSITVTDPTKIVFYKLLINLSSSTASNAIFTVASGNAIAVANSLVLVAGTVNTGTIEVRGAFTDNVNFVAGTGTLNFTAGAGSRNINLLNATQPAITINDVNVSMSAPADRAVTFSGAFTLTTGAYFPDAYATTFSSTYSQSGGTFWNGTKKISMKGTVSVTAGTFYGTGDTLEFDAASVTFGASATFNHNNGTISFADTANTAFSTPVTFTAYNLYVNLTNSSNYILSLNSGDTVVVNNSLALVKGKINTGYIKLVGNLASVTTFNGGSAIIYVAGGALRTINLPGTTAPGILVNDANATVNGPTSGTLTLQGDITIQKGAFNGGAGAIVLSGNFTQTGGTFTGSTGKLDITGNFAVSGTGTAFTAPSDSLKIGGTFTVTTPATFTHNGGTLYFSGAINTVLSYNTGATLTLKNLSIGYTGNAQLRPNCNLSLTGTLVIGSAAVLNQSTSGINITVTGAFTDLNSAQGLVYGTSTVTLNGSSSQNITGAAGTENFYNLTLSNTSGGVHPASTNLYVYNTLTFTASSGAKLYLGGNNVTLNSAASISGGTSTEYAITDGTGYLRQEGIGAAGRTGSILFPVGNTASNYAPVTLKNTGTSDRFDVRIAAGAWASGTGGAPVVKGTLNQTYFVEEAVAGGSNVTLTLQWNASCEFPGFNRSHCGIRHYTGGAWQHEGTDGVATGSGPYSSTASGITSFSPFDDGSDSSGGSLPIQLVNFTGSPDNAGNVNLEWATQIEINNHYFTLERSSDAENYTEIAQVDGADNSTVEHDYTYQDAQPLDGVNYYRLKQTDYNGQFVYEGVVAVTVAKTTETKLTLWPNPIEGRDVKIAITGSSPDTGNITLNITDLSGRKVYSGIIAGAPVTGFTLPQNMLPGIYLVQLNSGADIYKQKLVVK